MGFLEFVSFVVGLAALIILSVKKAQDEKKLYERRHFKESHHEDFEEEEEEAETENLISHRAPPPPPLLKPRLTTTKSHRIEPKLPMSKLDSRYQEESQNKAYLSPYDSNTFEVIANASGSRVKKLISDLPSKKTMIILQELLGPPKGLKNERW